MLRTFQRWLVRATLSALALATAFSAAAAGPKAYVDGAEGTDLLLPRGKLQPDLRQAGHV